LFICSHFFSLKVFNSNIYKELYRLEHALSQAIEAEKIL
jgi:hypothetical protein